VKSKLRAKKQKRLTNNKKAKYISLKRKAIETDRREIDRTELLKDPKKNEQMKMLFLFALK